jgi:cytochrome P450
VRDELLTLFLAGHETTSNALTWTFYLLSKHPEVEQKLSAELSRVLGGRLPSFEDLESLPYTEQVLKEAMRLYPPAYMVARRAIEDTRIGGYPVAKGSDVVLWIYLTHRHPDIYREPLVFRPERFSKEEEAKLPRLSYLPFGAGPRTCIGKHFAMVEGRLMLAIFARRFRFDFVGDREVETHPRVTLTPKGGVRMRLRAKG